MTASKRTLITRRVYYADTDAGGVAHHSAYVRWCEQARTEWLRERDFPPDVWAALGLVFVVTSLQLDYQAPVKLDDLISIATWPRKFRPVSAIFAHTVTYDDQLMMRGDIRVACISLRTNRPTRIPPKLLTA